MILLNGSSETLMSRNLFSINYLYPACKSTNLKETRLSFLLARVYGEYYIHLNAIKLD